MKNFLLTFTCYTIAIPIVIGQRYLLPALDTTTRYLWSLLVEPEQAPTLAAVVPLPTVQPDEAPPVKAAVKRKRTSSTKATTRKRTTKVTPLGDDKGSAPVSTSAVKAGA